MDIKTFKTIAPQLPAEIAVLMRGPTGVGKSHLVAQVAEALGKELIDVRGSTMSEGDTGGYPDIEGMKKNGIMTFCMPSWFIRACREGVVLFLDEVNRSLPGVQQSFFQLVLERQLGNDEEGIPHRLHPETVIFAAINQGAEYDVNDMDPALLRRFWVVDLVPTVEDFLSWAEGKLDPILIDFIRQNQAHLRVDPGSVEPGTVCPNPASWHRLDTTLKHMGMPPADLAGSGNTLLYSVAHGFVGTEAAIAFQDFVTKYDRVISAEDILDNFGQVKDRIKEAEASTLTALIAKLGNHCKDNAWTKAQAKNLVAFADELNNELLVVFWNKVCETPNYENIQLLHTKLGKRVVDAVKEARETAK